MQTITIQADNETSGNIVKLLSKIKGIKIAVTEQIKEPVDATAYVLAQPTLAKRLKKYIATKELTNAVSFDTIKDTETFFKKVTTKKHA